MKVKLMEVLDLHQQNDPELTRNAQDLWPLPSAL